MHIHTCHLAVSICNIMVMHILIADISLIVSIGKSVTIAIKSNHYNISVRLTYLHLNILNIIGSCSSLVSNVFYHLRQLSVVGRTLTTRHWCMHLFSSTIVTVSYYLQPCKFHPYSSSAIGFTIKSAIDRSPTEMHSITPTIRDFTGCRSHED